MSDAAALDTAESSSIRTLTEDLGTEQGRRWGRASPEPGTAVQWSLIMAYRAYALGDLSALQLLRVVIGVCSALLDSAPWPEVKECASTLADVEPRDDNEQNALERVTIWSHGLVSTRAAPTSAKEWGRELDHVALITANRTCDRADCATHHCMTAAIDVEGSAYAAALAFLLADRGLFAVNVYRMLRGSMGVAIHARGEDRRWLELEGVAPQDSALAPVEYGLIDHTVRGELFRCWPSVVALSGGRDGLQGPPGLPWSATLAEQVRRARLRGWVPQLHGRIPPEAFEPYPNEREREDGHA